MSNPHSTTPPARAEALRVYSHADCLAHDPGAGHPEAAFRLRAVLEVLNALGISPRTAPRASIAQLHRAHAPALIDALLLRTNTPHSVRIDEDTVIGTASVSAALHAAGAGVAAVSDVLQGAARSIFCAVRPPGHHATREQSMGFCLINSIAVAAYAALDAGLERVSIVDFDVHHGNGTQDIFWHEARVQYLSSHQAPLYPGTGSAEERGAHGTVHNAPLARAAGSAEFRSAYETQLLPALRAFAPQLLLISAGFDGHALDPLAGLNLHESDFAWLTHRLCEQAKISAQGRIISMLEGGYSETALKLCAHAHLHTLQQSFASAKLETSIATELSTPNA
jgi:acetoin utilization deacetylase AcuC-like enzyme